MRHLRVLLVDDHDGFINAAMRHFRKVDWLEIAGTAGNGLEAIERSEALRPDAILMDLAMPEMGGLQATRLIKAQDEPPYIVIASRSEFAAGAWSAYREQTAFAFREDPALSRLVLPPEIESAVYVFERRDTAPA